MGDARCAFLYGENGRNQRAQARRIVMVRAGGSLAISTAPRRAVHTLTTRKFGVFERFETIEVEVHEKDEEALDLLFDRFCEVAFEIYGPNIRWEFDYEWGNDDSKGGGHNVRGASLTFAMQVRFSAFASAKPAARINEIDGTFGIEDQ